MRLKSRVDTDFQPRHKEKSSVFYRGLCLHSERPIFGSFFVYIIILHDIITTQEVNHKW